MKVIEGFDLKVYSDFVYREYGDKTSKKFERLLGRHRGIIDRIVANNLTEKALGNKKPPKEDPERLAPTPSPFLVGSPSDVVFKETDRKRTAMLFFAAFLERDYGKKIAEKFRESYNNEDCFLTYPEAFARREKVMASLAGPVIARKPMRTNSPGARLKFNNKRPSRIP